MTSPKYSVTLHGLRDPYHQSVLLFLLIVACLLFLMFTPIRYEVSRGRYLANVNPERRGLVTWRRPFGDGNMSILIQPNECEQSYRPLILVPLGHSGTEYFIQSIKPLQQLRQFLQSEEVGFYDFTETDGNWSGLSRTDEAREINIILENRTAKQIVFIASKITNVTTVETSPRSPLVVILMRDPFQVLLSHFYQKIYGTSLFGCFNNMTSGDFQKRVTNVSLSFERCVQSHGKDCTDGILSFSVLKLLTGISLQQNDWRTKIIPAAQANVTSRGIIIADMDDFDNLTFMFERIAPRVCRLYQRNIDLFEAPLWTKIVLPVISEKTKKFLIEGDPLLHFEHRFYLWAKQRYNSMKRMSFHYLRQIGTIC